MTHALPYSVFLGRVVEPGEPTWLPEDRDMVELWLEQSRQKMWCGHWDWEEREGLEPGYLVCRICAAMGPYEEKVRSQNRDRNRDRHGLTFAWVPPREDEDGD